MLHILRHSPSSTVFDNCLESIDDSSHLLLIEDAVYAVVKLEPRLAELKTQGRVSVLASDLVARGLNTDNSWQVDYSGFVKLTGLHCPSFTW
ncbi:sulfurtransferase complex subunit TusB [Agarivorans sp. MS3-6]|uniref:sulfurtransferase complex subunit TusB n=1 Tax=Agarivorans sp. TSD2052 TaxID=2937286 RepID=UPI00200DDEF4|nr:sulfurtransferase complex subunit TusB [Agarivorans sp. TSD2052]UPW19141.1 sulfurtransferase complex subunit TusB [Agarivorans sp. TSD2052]